MSMRSNAVRKPKLLTLGLASIVALCADAGACKDPNPTFVFDSGAEAAAEAGGERPATDAGSEAGGTDSGLAGGGPGGSPP